MIYKFAQVYYLFVVKKVDTIEATGYRKAARLLKVVFEAYRRDDKGDPLRCDEERIAQHFYQVLSNGCWHTVDNDDRAFLEALGLKPDLNPHEDLGATLIGQWIEGRPGFPGPSRFSPLEEFEAIQSPAPAAFPPTPPASTIAWTPAVSLADTSASADCPSRQGTAGTMRDFSSVHESISSETSNCTKLLSELERLPDRIVEKIQPLIVSGVSNCVDDMTDRPSRAAETAYRAYQCAEEKLGTRIGDKEAYEWLCDFRPTEYTLPPYENWARYLRQARKHYSDQKHRPRTGRTGHSIVHQSEI